MADEIEILFVDDDRFFARTYTEQLEEAGFVVHYCQYGAEIPRFIDEHPNIRAIILDIMMPTPEGIRPSVTNNGLDTGLWLLGEIREDVVHVPRPVLILTNRSPLALEERLPGLDMPNSVLQVRRKSETPAEELPRHIENLIRGAREESGE